MVPSQNTFTVSFADTTPCSITPRLTNLSGSFPPCGTFSPTSTIYGSSSSLSSTVKVIRNLSTPPLKTLSPPESTLRLMRSAQRVVGIAKITRETKLRKKRKFAFLMDCFWAAFHFVSGRFSVNSVLGLGIGWLLQAAPYISLFFDTRFSLLVASPKITKFRRFA